MHQQSATGLGFIYDLYRNALNYNLTYAYNGEFSQELTNKILSFAEGNMEDAEESSKVKKRVYFIMVESLQNITRHQDAPSVKKHVQTTPGFFLIHRLANNYHIISGNIIENHKIESLREILNKVNSLDQESLKALQKEVLSQGTFSEKGGAGLGLIEMARKSGNKLQFDFKKVSDEFSYFYFQTNVLGETNQSQNNAIYNDLPSATAFHKNIIDDNINLLYQGEFSQESLLNLLSMTEGNIGDGIRNELLKKRIFNIIVELLQNIYNHGEKLDGESDKKGIFIIGERNGKYFVAAGNPVLNDKVKNLKEHMDKINRSDTEQLSSLYNQVIAEEGTSGGHSNGLGLMDMKLKSQRNLAYEFTPINDKFAFYSIHVTIEGN